MIELTTPMLVAMAGGMVFLAHFFAWLFSFTAIPDGLFLLGVGLLLGASGGQLLLPAFFGESGLLLLTIALVIILFNSGSRLQLTGLKSSLWPTVLLTTISFILTATGIGLVVWLVTDLPFLLALMIGTMLGGISSAVVLPLFKQLSLGETSQTILTLESVLSDVLAIVITIGLLSAHVTGQLSIADISLNIGFSFAAAIFIGFIAGVGWSFLLDAVRHMQNSIFVTLAFILLLSGLVEIIDISGPITALAFGITLGNIIYIKNRLIGRYQTLASVIRPETISRRERAFFSEIVFLLNTFFFVFVGMSVEISSFKAAGTGAALTILIIFIRWIAVHVSIHNHNQINSSDKNTMVVLIPKGAAAAILAALVLQSGISQGPLVQEIVYAVIVWSIVATSVLVFFRIRSAKREQNLAIPPNVLR